MSALVEPIPIGAVGLANLRFFAPPSGGRECPWLSIDDLHACLVLPRGVRRELNAKLRTSKWKDDVETIATPEGIVTIVPRFMAQGMIDAMRDVGQIREGFYAEYVRQGAAAMSKLTDGMGPEEMLGYVKAAWTASGEHLRSGGAP
ncbi:hypothetical protein [Lichenifustis flavocetrariae]|uniref:Uncharacterized protein n=1 Tax=Lichenifustis flavocetrariae TaxID=2949735 RepID=A0AA42CNY1_9HYPH|nr:hypothetical protein [Lichenifustis flavocetrariae]MCW6513291.1 hypothetical protein [Lichenifustis flavocetrariae]